MSKIRVGEIRPVVMEYRRTILGVTSPINADQDPTVTVVDPAGTSTSVSAAVISNPVTGRYEYDQTFGSSDATHAGVWRITTDAEGTYTDQDGNNRAWHEIETRFVRVFRTTDA